MSNKTLNEIRKDVSSALCGAQIRYNTSCGTKNGIVVHYYSAATQKIDITCYKVEKNSYKSNYKTIIKYASGETIELKETFAQELYYNADRQYDIQLKREGSSRRCGRKVLYEATSHDYLQTQRQLRMAQKKTTENVK